MRIYFLLLISSLVTKVLSDNNDPVVLVHGLASDDTAFQYYPEIEESGLTTIRVKVNGYTSNHDRAAELFAQLKGTIVDYGICHSRFYGHLRFGEDFRGRGLLEDWGEDRKVHFMGHSMGGTTIRTLERYLEVGNGCEEDVSELYVGNKNWITSISTLATPFDGTTFFYDMPGNDPVSVIETVISFVGFALGDLDFPQWGLVQGEDESFRKYWRRVKQSGLLESEDFSIYDLSIEGSEKFNSNGAQKYEGRYYYAYAAERTNSRVSCGILLNCEKVERPALGMSIPLKFSARWIGQTENIPDRPNDGAVNQIRARCPSNDNCLDVENGSFNWEKNEWQVVSIGYLDHFQITDRDNRNDRRDFEKSAKRLYLEHGVKLKSLESTSVRRDSEEEIFVQSEKMSSVKRYLSAMKVLSTPMVVEDIEEGENKINGNLIFVLVGSVSLVSLLVTFKKYKQKNEREDLEVVTL